MLTTGEGTLGRLDQFTFSRRGLETAAGGGVEIATSGAGVETATSGAGVEMAGLVGAGCA